MGSESKALAAATAAIRSGDLRVPRRSMRGLCSIPIDRLVGAVSSDLGVVARPARRLKLVVEHSENVKEVEC